MIEQDKQLLLKYIEQFDSFQKTQKKYGTSYYLGTLFFPAEVREATFAFYSWVRIPDEIVDTAEDRSLEDTKKLLQAWKTLWIDAYENKQSDIPVMDANQKIFHRYNIPFEHSINFIAAMEQDLFQERYQTYEELQDYMYGSAGCVGLVMAHIIGFEGEQLARAETLGEAMQVTNFLRDIDEDYIERWRVYMPLDDLAKFNLSEKHIKEKDVQSFVPFLKEYIKKNDKLYLEAFPGILGLKRGKFAVLYASNLYQGILRAIERNNYNIFNGKLKTTKKEKFIILLKTIWQLTTKKKK